MNDSKIPEAAVEAAARAWCGTVDLRDWQRRHITKILEAAAPHMTNQTTKEGWPAMSANTTERDELADLIASVTIDTKSGDILRTHPNGETPVFENDQRTADALLAAGYRKIICCPDPMSACSDCPTELP